MEKSKSEINAQSTIKNQVLNLFNKKFTIANNEDYKLPSENVIFESDVWKVDELQACKEELNKVKNLLNNYNLTKWHQHTRSRNSANDIVPRLKATIHPEFITQGWCKFYEILASYPVVPLERINNEGKGFKSIHVSEGPGAFVSALNHWIQLNARKIDWDWIATTLNPYYEGNDSSIMIADDRFIGPTLNHWCFGEDNTGDIMVLRNLDNLVDVSKPNDNVFLVTADGSIDCLGMPGEQEGIVAHLHFCETIVALSVLAPGGSFVLKIFTTFECHTICLLYLLSCCFGKVNLFKPVTSKEGNSEIYVICLNFKDTASKHMDKFRSYYESGCTKAMFDKTEIPERFIKKIIQSSIFFKNKQSQVITDNVVSYEASIDDEAMEQLKELQKAVANKYIEKYKVKNIDFDKRIVKLVEKPLRKTAMYRKDTQDSYNDLCMKKESTGNTRFSHFLKEYGQTKFDWLPINSVTEAATEGFTICIGKSFDKALSSRFCDNTVLKLREKLVTINHDARVTIEFPQDFEKEDLKKIMDIIDYTVLQFKYTDPYNNYKTIELINKTLKTLKHGETLILTGYSLLTRFNVGLLHKLKCLFNDMEFIEEIVLGPIIILKEFSPVRTVVEELEKIACLPCPEGKTILEIIPPYQLYESDIFPMIVSMNNWEIQIYTRQSLQLAPVE